MISSVASKYQTNYKPLINAAPSFDGNKDILIIDEYVNVSRITEALGDKANKYTIHTALGGKEGLEKAKQIQPFLTITAYNMREYHPYGFELIKALKELGTKVVVLTSNWWQYGIESMKAGAKKCEEEAGADKYIFDFAEYDTVRDPCKREFYKNNYPWNKVLKETFKALIEGKELPKYPFQEEEKKLKEKLKEVFKWFYKEDN